jgi:ketosteroid isomerase-like protein
VYSIRSLATAAVLAALCAGPLAPASAAATPAAATTRIQVEQALRAVEQALARGDSATELAKLMYADNVVITGEGQEGSTRGMAGAIRDFQAWIDSVGPATAGCRFTIVDPVTASATTFSSFVQLHCAAKPKDQDYRVLYAWKKQPEGWRVVLEMYLSGKL